jgi:hypothetical protein
VTSKSVGAAANSLQIGHTSTCSVPVFAPFLAECPKYLVLCCNRYDINRPMKSDPTPEHIRVLVRERSFENSESCFSRFLFSFLLLSFFPSFPLFNCSIFFKIHSAALNHEPFTLYQHSLSKDCQVQT